MKIAIIGSTAYEWRMAEHKTRLKGWGHEVRIPALDHLPGNELDIISYNREMIEWADEVHLIWDGRSMGSIFDLGMVFALRKKLVIVYINPKKFLNFVEQYGEKFGG
jgi:hypothetical protein